MLFIFASVREPTGGPISSCEMIILQNKSRGEMRKVCMGIFRLFLRIKDTVKFPIKIQDFHRVSLIIWPLTVLLSEEETDCHLDSKQSLITIVRKFPMYTPLCCKSTFLSKSKLTNRECCMANLPSWSFKGVRLLPFACAFKSSVWKFSCYQDIF